LELVTYCLLRQGTPTVIPCGAWLYCSWQVPSYEPARKAAGIAISLRLEEVKACLGPGVMVTAHESGRRARLLVACLSAGGRSPRELPSDLLVILVGRVTDAYVSARELVAMAEEAPPSRRCDCGISRERPGRQLLRRYLRTHRETIEELRRLGGRWLDCGQLDRLGAMATYLAVDSIDREADRRARSKEKAG
jgi:hypothetical protein